MATVTVSRPPMLRPGRGAFIRHRLGRPQPSGRRAAHQPHEHASGESWTAFTDALPLHDVIADRAFALWQAAGQPEGQAMRHWLEAERQVRYEMQIADAGG